MHFLLHDSMTVQVPDCSYSLILEHDHLIRDFHRPMKQVLCFLDRLTPRSIQKKDPFDQGWKVTAGTKTKDPLDKQT